MLYWMNDLTGEVKALEDGRHPGEKWFEISPAEYAVSRHSRPTQDAADACQRCGGRGEVRNEGFVWVACPVCDGKRS